MAGSSTVYTLTGSGIGISIDQTYSAYIISDNVSSIYNLIKSNPSNTFYIKITF